MGRSVLKPRFEAGQIIRSARHLAHGTLRVQEVAGQMVQVRMTEPGPDGERETFWIEERDCREGH